MCIGIRSIIIIEQTGNFKRVLNIEKTRTHSKSSLFRLLMNILIVQRYIILESDHESHEQGHANSMQRLVQCNHLHDDHHIHQ